MHVKIQYETNTFSHKILSILFKINQISKLKYSKQFSFRNETIHFYFPSHWFVSKPCSTCTMLSQTETLYIKHILYIYEITIHIHFQLKSSGLETICVNKLRNICIDLPAKLRNYIIEYEFICIFQTCTNIWIILKYTSFFVFISSAIFFVVHSRFVRSATLFR